MKLRGILGTASGKLGEGVAATVAGQTIMRQYQPNVKNPNTDAQVAQRARLKLASQLAAAMSPVIVIGKQGLQSSRNLFIKRNMQFITGTVKGAECEYDKLQITAGSVALPAVTATPNGTSNIAVALAESAAGIASRITYCIFRVSEDKQLVFAGSTIVSEAGADGTFPGTLPYVDGDAVVYAYGMRDTTENATAKYENYQIETADGLVSLLANHSLQASAYSFTATSGLALNTWVNPYPGATAKVMFNDDTSESIALNSENVQVGNKDIVGIEVFGVEEGLNVWAEYSNGQGGTNVYVGYETEKQAGVVGYGFDLSEGAYKPISIIIAGKKVWTFIA